MVDHLKKLTKSGVLDPGEQASAVLFVAPAGATAKMGATAGVGGIIGVAAGEAVRKRREKSDAADNEAAGHEASEGGLADQVTIGGQSYLALTDRRWAVATHGMMSGKPKEIAGAWELSAISAVEITKGKLIGKARVVFSDGSVTNLDVPKGQKLDRFVEAATAAGVRVTVS